MRLSPIDLDALNRTILELYAFRDRDAFRAVAPGLFMKIIPADYFHVYEFGVNPTSGKATISGSWESAPLDDPDFMRRAEAHAIDHPFTTHSLRTDGPTALKLSDFFSLRELHGSRLYSEVYRPSSVDRMVAIGSVGPSGMTTLNYARRCRSRDFTERDRLMLNLLKPHFDQARHNAELATARRAAGGQPMEAYALTPRETEVARWLAGGKTNVEIARILASSSRTIEKHVASILRKLGVENRTTAALLIAAAAER
jgi:DNA-binding CsgD family transcriptional regulator